MNNLSVKFFLNLVLLGCLIAGSIIFTGCEDDVVYRKAVGELNTKAKALQAAGDHKGAIGRLEASLDLLPDDVPTRYNLAIAYKANGDFDKSLSYFDGLIEGDNDVKKASLYKAKGIVFETMGDEAMEKVSAIELNEEEPDECFKEPGKIEDLKATAIVQYKNAIDNYEQALKEEGLTQTDMVMKQIKQLEERIEKIENNDEEDN